MSADWFAALPPVRLPAQVYVPVSAVDLTGARTTFEFRQTSEGERVALVYSSLDALVHCCGDYQPWLLLPANRMIELQREFEVGRIVLDLVLPQPQRHGSEGRDHGRR